MDWFSSGRSTSRVRPTTATSPPLSVGLSHADAIRAEQIRFLYTNAPAGLVTAGLNAGLLALMQWPVLPPSVILLWLTAMTAITVLRAALVWRFHRLKPAPHALRPWGIGFGIGAGLAGLGWGGAGVVLFPSTSLPHQVFLTFVVGGMIAGAVGLLAARWRVFLSFVCPAAVPIVIHLLMQSHPLAFTMGGMAALFTLVSVFVASRLHHLVLSSIELRFDNAGLVESVTAEKERVERLNAQLTAEIGERQRAEEALRSAHGALEQRVRERTAALTATLDQLHAETDARQRLAGQLRQAQHMEAIGRLAGGVAHDFNNMLAAITGYTELAAYTLPSSSPAGAYLQEVLSASQRAKALVHQILTFSRRAPRAHTPVQLRVVLQESLALLRASIPSSIEMRQHFALEEGVILGDATQLQQVVLNLCTNAEYAMRQTGGILEVRLEAVEADAALVAQHPALHVGPYVRLTVRDTGQGMPPEVVERIYEPFFTTKALGEGTGIGLSVVHGIVADHQGTIVVESRLGEGTTFTLYLPRLEDSVADTAAPPAEVPRGQGRVLLVDDEAALAELGQALLTTLGYAVVAHTSSLEALAVFQKTPHQFDLVITDYTMPQMTGEVLARALRAIRPDIPIILGTGFSYTMDAAKAQALGIDAFLLKPWTAQELACTIAEVLSRRRVPHTAPGAALA